MIHLAPLISPMGLPIALTSALVVTILAGCTGLHRNERVALIIGNSSYSHSASLKNPVHDASAISQAFNRLGFKVIEGRDLSRSAMDSQVQDFRQRLEKAEIAVLFYAGHGLQINHTNFLVPVDFNSQEEGELASRLFELDTVLSDMTQRARVSLVFLDACRDNPFKGDLTAKLSGGRSLAVDQMRGVRVVGEGLAEVKGRIGTLIAYATQPGNFAADGTGTNSPFTAALLKHLEDPGLEVRELLMQVRNSVVQETNGSQIPWDHSSLVENVYLKKKHRPPSPPP